MHLSLDPVVTDSQLIVPEVARQRVQAFQSVSCRLQGPGAIGKSSALDNCSFAKLINNCLGIRFLGSSSLTPPV